MLRSCLVAKCVVLQDLGILAWLVKDWRGEDSCERLLLMPCLDRGKRVLMVDEL